MRRHKAEEAPKNDGKLTEKTNEIIKYTENKVQVVELSDKYGVSMPRIHRICMKEENKALNKMQI